TEHALDPPLVPPPLAFRSRSYGRPTLGAVVAAGFRRHRTNTVVLSQNTMDQTVPGVTTVCLAFTVVLLFSVNYFLGPKYDPREPPVIHQKIPAKHPLPAFTLQTLSKRTYVVNSPDLVSAVQKNAKILSFNPFISFVSPRIFDADERAMAAINENIDGEQGHWGLMPELGRGIHNTLAPGASLDWMTKTMLTKYVEFVDNLGEGKNDNGAPELDLYKWVRKAFTVSSTEADAAIKNGCTVQHAARFQVGNLLGVLVNATPTFFWMLVFVFSNTDLLADLREEISSVVTTETISQLEIETFNTISVTKVKDGCPLLLSTYQETMRLQTHNSSSRWVTRDFLLADRYFLKANSVIQMPGHPIHTLTSIWGPDVESFNPRRFIKLENQNRMLGRQKQHPASFRSFGGGATLCPGRHFATAELCATVAMFAMRFDLQPVGGVWKLPKWKHGKVASAIPPPAEDVKVRITVRKGMEGMKWRYGFEGSVSKFEMFAG
ncbi:MAG: hypothetical protein Q9214_006529, partial [Letrouitia sp. 1 TL-2023]